jgi:hypothetical protein
MNTATLSKWGAVALAALATALIYAATAASCTPAQQAKFAKAEADVCKLRADYKLVAAAARGALDPVPGSPRAQLEAAEDRMCAALAAADAGAGGK